MNLKFLKRRGLAFKMILYLFLSIWAIFIVIFSNTQKVTREIVLENLESSAEHLTISTVSKVESVLGSIQRVPDNFAGIIEKTEWTDENIQPILRMMVENNEEITGACLAFEPYSIDPGVKFSSNYFYRKGDKIEFRWIGIASPRN